MPYKVVGRKVLHKIDGHWRVKQTAKSHERALRTTHLLRGIEHGWLPSKNRRKRK